jgi:hypothetical protein
MSVYANQLAFGAGVMIGTRTDLSGVQTPYRFGVLQDASLDFSADVKELWGQGRYAVALAPGKTKVSVKAKFAEINGAAYNAFYFGATTATTQTLFADSEAGTVPASSTYTVTVSNAASFLQDQGVYYAATGQRLAAGSAAATGVYTVAAGVYTFAVGDASKAVYISYSYSSTSGLQIPISNVKMGSGPSFRMVLAGTFDGRQANYIFNQCQCSKISMPFKQDDWLIEELDFMISADVAGNIGSINVTS